MYACLLRASVPCAKLGYYISLKSIINIMKLYFQPLRGSFFFLVMSCFSWVFFLPTVGFGDFGFILSLDILNRKGRIHFLTLPLTVGAWWLWIAIVIMPAHLLSF